MSGNLDYGIRYCRYLFHLLEAAKPVIFVILRVGRMSNKSEGSRVLSKFKWKSHYSNSTAQRVLYVPMQIDGQSVYSSDSQRGPSTFSGSQRFPYTFVKTFLKIVTVAVK